MRFVQIVESLDFGDAVSNQVIRLHELLQAQGRESEIYSKYAHHSVEHYRENIADFRMTEETILISHYAGYSETAERVSRIQGYKILVYHNVTPHQFFERTSSLYKFCLEGRRQFAEIVGRFNLVLGDSRYNCDEAEALGAKAVEVLPIVVPGFSEAAIAAAQPVVKQLQQPGVNHWLFTGRIAPNKRQDLVVDAFAKYCDRYPNSQNHLYLVGRYAEEDAFYQTVKGRVEAQGISDRVTFTGKVSDEELVAHFCVADLFLCLSQHEGFCVPIVESFYVDLPVVAYADTAVGDTMGMGPGALESLDLDQAVERIHRVFSDGAFRQALIDHGRSQVSRFSLEAVGDRFKQTLETICDPGLPEPPLVSVVICTYNRADYLERCFASLDQQDYAPFEVVVVNGPSTDGTAELLAQRDNLKVCANPERNLSISRNLGIAASSGDIVAFIDDDALPYADWLSQLVQRYLELPAAVVGVGGRTFLANKLKYQFEAGLVDGFGCHMALTNDVPDYFESDRYRHLLGTNCSFRRDALVQAGGFDEQYDYYLDESDVAVRLQQAGGLIANANEAYVRHEFAQSHNRLGGDYNFNWQTITKNTVYFGLKNAVHRPKSARLVRTAKMVLKDRCYSFWNAYRHGVLPAGEALRHTRLALTGAARGYRDALGHRKVKAADWAEKPRSEPLLYASAPATATAELTDSVVNPEPAGLTDAALETEAQSPSPFLHIAIISQEFPPHSFGGIGTYNQTLAKELVQLGHSVTVISRGLVDQKQVFGRLVQYEIATVPGDRFDPDFLTLSKNLAWTERVAQLLAEIHAQSKIDVIESALWDSEALGVLRHRQTLPVPLIVRVVTPLKVAAKMNDWQMSEDLERCIALEAELVSGADAVICISDSVRRSFKANYDVAEDSRWAVQQLGVQPWPTYANVASYGELPSQWQRGEFQLLFLGRLEGRKGIDVFVKSLPEVLKQDDRICVWIAGEDIEGWEAKAEAILLAGVRSRVQFFGRVSEADRELLYANCDVLVFPSRYESFGLVPLEAMVHGKPVVAARAAAIPEVVLDGDCGLLFESEQESELAEKLVQLAQDKALYGRLSAGAKARVQQLSARNMALASAQLYRQLKQQALQPAVLSKTTQDAFERLEAELEQTQQTLASTQAQPGQRLPIAVQPSEWHTDLPRIISYGKLNRAINRWIVPRVGQFIESVLFNSMQQQTAFNRKASTQLAYLGQAQEQQQAAIAEQLTELKDELQTKLKADFEAQLQAEVARRDQATVTEQQRVQGLEAWLKAVAEQQQVQQQAQQQALHQRTAEIEASLQAAIAQLTQAFAQEKATMDEQSAASLQQLYSGFEAQSHKVDHAMGDIMRAICQLQELTADQAEMSRSEFAYQLARGQQSESKVIAPEKLADGAELRLNLGCGTFPKEGYLNIDQRELEGVDVVADLRQLPFEPGSVQEIFNSHVIEHFTEYELRTHILPYWHSLLKPGGRLTIVCPDAESMIRDYAAGELPWEDLRKVTYGAQDYDGDYHYNMYQASNLQTYLEAAGFDSVELIERARVNGICYEMELSATRLQ